MISKTYELPLKHDPYANHLLRWSIVDEIRRGDHTFEGLRELVLSETPKEVRRYAEVVYCKTLNDGEVFHVLLSALNERYNSELNHISDIVEEFRDWGLSFSKDKGEVSQDIKAIKWR